MSRHRFVRNMDLDAEMADDSSGEDDGMTPEERAAKPLLKDLRPPVSDDKLYEALYHYWFDVDKSVAYLKREWEKKGEPIPTHLEPTPDQAPRSRPPKRQRLTPSTPTSTSASVSAPAATAPAADSALQPPLTALQRLSLSRKQSASSTPTIGSGGPATPSRDTASAVAGTKSVQEAGPSTPASSGNGANGGKPMSKLALLAQKRKEAAAAASGASPAAPSPSSLNNLARSSPQPASPASGTSSTAQVSDSSTGTATTKPLSKLAQKMAAAKAAREQAALAAIGIGSVSMAIQSSGSSSGSGPDYASGQRNDAASTSMPDDPLAAFFAPLSLKPNTAQSAKTRSRKSSPFFSIITSTARVTLDVDLTNTANIHLPPSRDPSKLENRIKMAFEGAESPDDVVLKARQGRAGTAGMTAATPTANVGGGGGDVGQEKAKPSHTKKVDPPEPAVSRQKAGSTGAQGPPRGKQVLEIGKAKPKASRPAADQATATATATKAKVTPTSLSSKANGKEQVAKQGKRPAGKGPQGRGKGGPASRGGTGAASGSGGAASKVST